MSQNPYIWTLNDVWRRSTVVCLLQITLHIARADFPTYYMSDYCSNMLDLAAAKVNAGLLLLHRPEQDMKALDCHVFIKAPVNKMLTFKFQQFDIKSSHECSSNYLQIFQDSERQLHITDKLCNTNMPDRVYITSGEDATVQLTKDVLQGDQIELVFTTFRFSPCSGDEFQCDNSHCIAKELYCNGFDNCGDRSDICLLKKETVIGITVGAAVIILVCAVIFTVCLIRRQRKIRQERVTG